MTEQLPFQGPYKTDCPCGCGLFGTPTKRGHVRLCRCKPCLAGKNSRRGKALHRKVARQLGTAPKGFATSSEEAWRVPWARLEVKTGAQAGPVHTRWEAARNQSNVSRPLGDGRPFVFVAWTGKNGEPPLAVIELAELVTLMEAL